MRSPYLLFSDSVALIFPIPIQTRSPERNSQPEDEFTLDSEPPPPFTPIGPSLDGPPFEEVVTLSYNGPVSPAATPRSPPPPLYLRPVEPLRLRSNRLSNTQVQTSSNPYPSHRQISPRPNPASTIARVEFDPQMAYSPYSGVGNHTSAREGAMAFYK